MGWDCRNARCYYSRTRRVGGGFSRQYVGGGPIGLLAAREDEERRQQAAEARERLQRQQAAFDAAAVPHERLSLIADALLTAALLDAGYHRRDRGHWRKERRREHAHRQ